MWRLRFEETTFIRLPMLKSDHSPLLIRTSDISNSTRERKPFRFMASWLANPPFCDVLHSAWSEGGNWLTASHLFRQRAEIWNGECYGNLFRRKRRLMGRLERIHNKLSMGRNPFLERF